MSQTGCFIGTKAALKLERMTEVDILFRLMGCEYRSVARVMAIRPGKGVGLEFLSHYQEVGESFQKLIQRQIDKSAPRES